MKTLPKYLLIITSIVSITNLQSCSKNECDNSKKGKLINLTGLDGCGWMIELNDGTILEPRNLNEFNIDLEENNKISVSYHTPSHAGSICMAGEIVDIDCIIER